MRHSFVCAFWQPWGTDVVSLTPLPGNEPQNLHRDGGNIDHIIACETSKPILEYWLCRGALSVRSAIGSHGERCCLLRSLAAIRTNCVIALVDFDAQNGPTRFVRGSHLRPHVGTWSRTKGPSKPGSTQHIQEGESGEEGCCCQIDYGAHSRWAQCLKMK